jgi:hypothetical protein
MAESWFGFSSSMLDGVLGEQKKEEKQSEMKSNTPKTNTQTRKMETFESQSSEKSQDALSTAKPSRAVSEELETTTPSSLDTSPRATPMAPTKKFRKSYLQAHDDFTKNWRTDLTNQTSQQVARVNLMEAISAVRSTLAPIKRIGPNFGSSFKWGGGTLSPDGRIFFAPHGADHVSVGVCCIKLCSDFSYPHYRCPHQPQQLISFLSVEQKHMSGVVFQR